MTFSSVEYQVTRPSFAPSQHFLCTFSLAKEERLKKSLTQNKHHLGTTETSVCYQHCAHTECKPSTGLGTEKKLTLSQLKPRKSLSHFLYDLAYYKSQMLCIKAGAFSPFYLCFFFMKQSTPFKLKANRNTRFILSVV